MREPIWPLADSRGPRKGEKGVERDSMILCSIRLGFFPKWAVAPRKTVQLRKTWIG